MTAPILLTAFDAFGPWLHNSTQDVVELAAAQLLGDGRAVETRTLPVVLSRAPEVEDLVAELAPSAVIACGLAGLARVLHIERVALNVADFRIPDNDGVSAAGRSLVDGDPDALLARVDLRAAVEAATGVGSAAQISNSAGTYLCNAVYFHVLRATRPRGIPALFIHCPPLPGRAERAWARAPTAVDPEAAMSLASQAAGVAAVARFLAGGALA